MRGQAGGARAVTLLGVLGVATLWLVWSPLGANDLVGGDEGYYGTLARNLLADRTQWLSPSLTPLGPPGDKPPLYPALLALSVAALGPTETALRWPSVLLAVLIALGVGALARRAGRAAGLVAGPWVAAAGALLLMTLPWYGDASRSAMSDIPLTASGVAALLVATGGPPTPRRMLLAGALLGLAFQCKQWLAGVFVLPALAAVLVGGGGAVRPALALAAAAAGVGALHLGAVALLEPGRLDHWWDVYARRMLAGRLADTASPYARPPGYYGTLLAHALVLLLPLAGLGLDRLRARWREPAALAVLGGCAAFLVLSVFTVKSAVYLYALLPAWVAAAAVGAAALAGGVARPGAFTVALAVAGMPPLVRALGGTPPPPGVWAAAWLGAVTALIVIPRAPRLAPAAAALLCLLAAGGGLVRQAQRLPVRYHDPGYREVARELAPVLADLAPDRASFVAPEAPAFAFHLFRTGLYWGTPREPWSARRGERLAADPSLRAFVVDPGRTAYGGWPDSATVRWLEANTRELTAGIAARAGRPLGVRVFVRR